MYVVFVGCVMLWLCWFICLGKYMLFVWKWENCGCVCVCLWMFSFDIDSLYGINFSKVMHLLGWVSDFSKLNHAFDDGHMRNGEVEEREKVIESIPHPQFMLDWRFNTKLHLIIIEQHKKQTVLQQISIYFGSLRIKFGVKLRFAIYFFARYNNKLLLRPLAHTNTKIYFHFTYWMSDRINKWTGLTTRTDLATISNMISVVLFLHSHDICLCVCWRFEITMGY